MKKENLDDLTVEQLKKKCEALDREAKAAMLTITKLLKDVSQKTEKIAHLEKVVAKAVPVIVPQPDGKVVVEISAELEITELQLERLKQAARIRPLTLEEVRAMDLLVKNKRLSKGESTQNLPGANYRELPDIELMKLASKADEQDNS